MRGFPDINGFYAMLYGTGGVDFGALTASFFGNASGAVFPGNPCFTATDFLGMYPKFFGCPTSFTGLTITSGSNVITGFTDQNFPGLAVGQLIVNLNSIPKDSVVTSLGTNTLTISNDAIANDTILTAYEKPAMPLMAILAYIFLARASVMYQRYNEMWWLAMSLFIAHYCTLYMRSEAGPFVNAAQIASSGLERGLIAAKSAGGVSAGIRFIDGYEAWGTWQETTYGTQFITLARSTNMGPVWVI
jgi:hypothetical protein